MSNSTLKLGTRKSLLAWAQSSWVAREIERLNPGIRVELEGIETRGDRILDVSLQQVEGKEFFVAELDQALASGRVDLTVHSMKDLSLDRPREFVRAAVPRRENPRDVVLFGPGVMKKIATGRRLRIGTSSPRRIVNIPPFLEQALPRCGGRGASVELVEIRGNVNTRLSRVHEPQDSERHLDGVVLAFAGLIRLWNDPAGREELAKLLREVRWMVLPLRECPAAPAQGALAVECRANDPSTIAALGKLHDARSAESAARERQLLADWGGGCHQKFGATAFSAPKLGDLMFVRGIKPDGAYVEELRWNEPARPSAPALPEEIWEGSVWRKETEKSDQDLPWEAELSGQGVFVSHSRAVPSGHAGRLSHSRVWTSGTASWFRLAWMGIWVEGCSEGFGFDFLKSTLAEGVLQLQPLSKWTVLTHQGALPDWQTESGMRPIATYQATIQYSEPAKEALKRAKYVFWSSGSQQGELNPWTSPNAHQASGPGKTSEKSDTTVFPSAEEWRKWLKLAPSSR